MIQYNWTSIAAHIITLFTGLLHIMQYIINIPVIIIFLFKESQVFKVKVNIQCRMQMCASCIVDIMHRPEKIKYLPESLAEPLNQCLDSNSHNYYNFIVTVIIKTIN